MIYSYNEDYVDEVMENIGCMMEHAVYDLAYAPEEFYSLFVSSEISEEVANGNPKYTVGMSGIELAREVLFECTGRRENKVPTYHIEKSAEYWTGWILAYYQWKKCLSFERINTAIPFHEVMKTYPTLHEADIEKAVDVFDEKYKAYKSATITELARIRKLRGLSQKELSERSGVALRMIQLYEQRQNDISKAQVDTVMRLSRTLSVRIEKILDI
ncbi:MAG: helix-turn-helix transcriptional regulator [Lachnospiraceae bacterium]